MRAWILSLLFVGVALAGCASDSTEPTDTTGEEVVDREGFQFAGGTGAIAGLLVDDRFRPIDLEPEGSDAGEFQSKGFILVQETGQQLRTNENGEFNVLDLEPGTYTIRVSAEGHEAIPQKVSVTAGEFAEINVVARRVSSESNTILTEEYSAFVSCVFTASQVTFSPDCTGDQSGDSDRFAFYPDYTIYPDLTVMITELLLLTPAGGTSGSWGVSVRDPSAITNGIYYSEGELLDGSYLKLTNVVGEVSEDGGRNTEFNNDIDFQVALFGQGLFQGELESVTSLAGRGSFGVGVQIGQRATFIQSLFLGEPEQDITTYCVLC